MKSALRILTLGVLAVSLNACKKDDVATTDTAMPTTATTTDASGFEAGDIDMGRHIGPDKKISDKTDDFAPTDTIYASLNTKTGAAPAMVMARWTFEDGTVVSEETQTVAAGADAVTEFHVMKKGGWPKGKYTVHIMADGKEVKTKDVTVK
ncbi:MAG: hypothetical protein ABIR92_00650 [Gemmatimonadaceae bacterium]